DLEFPEAFFTKGGAKENAGFDIVIGNPPYDELSEVYSDTDKDVVSYFTNHPGWSPYKHGRVNLYRLFIIMAARLTKPNGMQSFIVPMGILSDKFSLPVRCEILLGLSLHRIEVFPQKDDPRRRIFPEAKLSTCVYVLQIRTTSSSFIVRIHSGRDLLETSRTYTAKASEIQALFPSHMAIPLIGSDEWMLLIDHFLLDNATPLKDVAEIYAGEICDNAQNAAYLSNDPIGPLVLRGANIDRYLLRSKAKQGKPRYLRVERYLAAKRDSAKARHHEALRIGFQKGAAIDNWRRIIGTIIPPGYYCFDTIMYLVPKGADDRALLGILNSELWEWRFRATSVTNHANTYEIQEILIPNSLLEPATQAHAKLVALVDKALTSEDEMQVVRAHSRDLEPNSIDRQIDTLVYEAYRVMEPGREIIRSALALPSIAAGTAEE
ncbi:MAG: Eco57I restriction-modification methylase domain-containing protein, partial [Dehalococcoidia bacterium]